MEFGLGLPSVKMDTGRLSVGFIVRESFQFTGTQLTGIRTVVTAVAFF